MRLPILSDVQSSRDMIDVFKGYNHNLKINENEFYDMKNFTSSYYPTLAVRQKRGTYTYKDNEEDIEPVNPIGLISKESLCYIADNKFYINDKEVKDLTLTASQKQMVSMGAYVIIMPDKKWINTTTLEYGDIEATSTTSSNVLITLCKEDGGSYNASIVTTTRPSNPTNGSLWIDTTTNPHSLQQYSESLSDWVTVTTTYIKISVEGKNKPFKDFNEGDGVFISGLKNDQLTSINNSISIIQKKTDNYIVITGIIDQPYQQSDSITIKRQMPNMDFIIESENRLWGCRYGTSNDGKIVNEIYASKLGDFKNWNCFAGISTDSYVATVGTDGQFTGAIAHLGHPIFFKENCLHKIYGNFPSNFQINTTTCRGVQKGSSNSLAIVNEMLYYKSRSAICGYDGSLPVEVSYALGEVPYSHAVACSYANKYYICMHDDTITKDLAEVGNWVLLVYDTSKGMWHKEDNVKILDFCSFNDELYFVEEIRTKNKEEKDGEIIETETIENKIRTMFGSGKTDIGYVNWMVETGIIGTNSPDKKNVSKLNVRMSFDIGTRAFFYVQYDSTGVWEYLFTMDGTALRSFTIPIRPKRCDHLKLRIEGYGEAKIYSIAKTIEVGSDK